MVLLKSIGKNVTESHLEFLNIRCLDAISMEIHSAYLIQNSVKFSLIQGVRNGYNFSSGLFKEFDVR